jgi:gliding motility-associated-like protein
VGSSETVTYTYEGTGTTIYAASSQKPTQAGTYQVTAAVEADSNFEGITSAPLAFEIARKSLDTDIADFTIDDILDVIYSGLAQEPQPSILYGDVRLFNDFDFTLGYTANVNAGTATVRVTGIRNYAGEINRTFIIKKANLTLRMDGQVVRYGSDPAAIITDATFTYDGFVPGDDADDVTGTIVFETDFTNTTPAGDSRNVTANLTTLNAANYDLYQASGLVEVIKALSTIDASGDIEFTYTGAPQGPAGSTVVGSSGNVIYTYTGVAPTVYVASTDLPVDAGSYEMVAEVLTDSNYEGKISSPYAFEILPKSLNTLNDITVDSIPSLVYDGSEQEPKPVIKDGLVTLTEGIDYDLIYDDNKNAGISTITIEGKGNYSNSIQTQFEIQKRKLIITPTEGLGKERLSEDPVLTFELDAPLEEGDVFAGELVRESGEENGTYLISLGTLDAGPNYQIEFVESEFTIVDTTSPSLILTGSDEPFDQDNKSNQMIYEVSLIEGDQPLDSFNADEDVVWTLEPSGDTDQVSLFELIENEDGTRSVRFKEESKPGEYQVNLCSTDPSGNKTCLTIVIKVRVKTIILNLVIDENNEEELAKDPNTNIAIIEKVIPEGEQRVASFTTDNELVWGLESFGDRDDTGLFELVFDTEDGNSLPSGKILNLRTSDAFIKRVSVVFKDKSIAGFYQVKLSARDLFGNESFVVIKVTVLADVLAVLTIENQVEIPWGSSVLIKAQQQVLTSDGESPLVDVQLNETPLDRFARGDYRLTGELLLPDYLKNPSDLKADIIVRVLPKPAPIDLTLSQNVFEADLVKEFLFVGNFQVVDPVDDIHEVELYNDGYDNKYFEIKDKVLFWSSADPGAGKTKFTILVRVTDRDGNTLDEFFEITRTRQSIRELEIYNTFTPNADGINDDWGVPGIRFYGGARIEVFDGGGIRMFYTEDAKIRWDGTHKGKAMPVGSYYWIIEVDETGEQRKGIVNLLRN